MSLWTKLFGGGSNPRTPATTKPSQLPRGQSSLPTLPLEQTSDTGKGYVVVSGTSENMQPGMRAISVMQTLKYDGGPIERFYERMSKDLVEKHGPLVGVDYVSHFPKFEIWFRYKDGTRIYSGQRTGNYDIHFLTMGYVGEGPRYMRHFLGAAGLSLTDKQIESIRPGDSVELRDGKASIVHERQKVVDTGGVTFDREEKRIEAGFPATYRYYKAATGAAAMAFLEKQKITAVSFFVAVDTPEGVFCKDCEGLYGDAAAKFVPPAPPAAKGQDGIELIDVPGGEFIQNLGGDRKPTRLAAFKIMKFPVTVSQYRKFCEATNRQMPDAPPWGWLDNHPIVNVTWHDASAFAEWAGLALPTPAEWQKAACGTDGRDYPWGSDRDATKCHCSAKGREADGTCAVGQYPTDVSPYGVRDMAGNVNEWGEGNCAWSPSSRYTFGGNWWASDTSALLVNDSHSSEPSFKSDGMGFRCVQRK